VDSHSAGAEGFEPLRARLESLIDSNPTQAVEEARSLPPNAVVDGVPLAGLKAAILVDAGSCAGDTDSVAEGVELFRDLLKADPGNPHLHYNIANGLVALADQEPYMGFDWYLRTGEMRREAREHFQTAACLEKGEGVASVAFTNMGNSLWKAARWAEAYDAYSRALQHDRTNAVAATGAARVLLRCMARGMGERKVVLSVAARHLKNAKQNASRIEELAGTRAYEELSKLLEKHVEGGQQPDLSRATEYERFVASNRLSLCPTVEGLDPSLKRWDSLLIQSIAEPLEREFGVPPLFALFNVLKSDFLVARFLAYQALSGAVPESGSYLDTLDYAVYGVTPGALSLAQRACIDVLDKIAVATTEYFGATSSSRRIYFTNRWFAKAKGRGGLEWDPEMGEHIQRGNTAIIALAELSLDLQKGGSLRQKKSYRNSSTHRFTVLHDLGCDPSRKSAHVDHCRTDEFESHVLESLQLARAAILYFVELVSIGEEHKKARGHRTARITVPSHHWIRGEDEDAPRGP